MAQPWTATACPLLGEVSVPGQGCHEHVSLGLVYNMEMSLSSQCLAWDKHQAVCDIHQPLEVFVTPQVLPLQGAVMLTIASVKAEDIYLYLESLHPYP